MLTSVIFVSASNTGSYCVHKINGVDRYLYVCQFIGPCLSCVCLFVCDIKLDVISN